MGWSLFIIFLWNWCGIWDHWTDKVGRTDLRLLCLLAEWWFHPECVSCRGGAEAEDQLPGPSRALAKRRKLARLIDTFWLQVQIIMKIVIAGNFICQRSTHWEIGDLLTSGHNLTSFSSVSILRVSHQQQNLLHWSDCDEPDYWG